MQVADFVIILGRDRNEAGEPIPGARVQENINLMDAGLTWREGLNSTPEFVEVERKIRERFRTL